MMQGTNIGMFAAASLAMLLAASSAVGRQAAPPAPIPAPAPTPGAPKPLTATPGVPPTAMPGANPQTGPLPPLAVIGPQNQNVGVRSPLELVSGAFRLRNTASEPLTITKVEAGCRCTFGVVTNPVVPPGGETLLNYEIDVRGTVGPLRKPILVTVAGFNRKFEVVVSGELQYAVRSDPGDLKPDGDGNVRFTLSSTDGVPFKVMSVNGDAPTVQARTPAEGEKAMTWTLTYNVQRLMPYAVVVETDHPKAPVIDLRVMSAAVSTKEIPFFRVINDIAIGRHLVNLGVVKPGGSAEFDMYITRIKDFNKPVTLATDGGDIKLELIEMGAWRRPDDNHLKIRVKFDEKLKGMQLFPVYVTSEGKTNRTWACAIVK